jgi:hypothetical protein
MISCQHAPTQDKIRCTDEQVKKLQEYVKEMWASIVPEKDSNGYFDPYSQKTLDSFVKNPLDLEIHNFHKLRLEHLDISEGYPIAWRNAEKKVIFVQLRPITENKSKLLLGCGNNPTSICYHYPMSSEFEKECISYGIDSNTEEYFSGENSWAKTIISQTLRAQERGKIHTHEGYTTIDPNPVMNPDIVGMFGWYKIPSELIPDNSMLEIYSEGIRLDSYRNVDHDYKRITGKTKNRSLLDVWYD